MRRLRRLPEAAVSDLMEAAGGKMPEKMKIKAEAYSAATGTTVPLSADRLNAVLTLFDGIASQTADDTVHVTYEFGIDGILPATVDGRPYLILKASVRRDGDTPAAYGGATRIEVLADGEPVEVVPCDETGHPLSGTPSPGGTRWLRLPLPPSGTVPHYTVKAVK